MHSRKTPRLSWTFITATAILSAHALGSLMEGNKNNENHLLSDQNNCLITMFSQKFILVTQHQNDKKLQHVSRDTTHNKRTHTHTPNLYSDNKC